MVGVAEGEIVAVAGAAGAAVPADAVDALALLVVELVAGGVLSPVGGAAGNAGVVAPVVAAL